jgi:5'(3')-deoxyribonucleotidase
MTNKTIYLDMDGVVADFNKFSSDVLNEPYDVSITKFDDEKWAILKQHPRLYRDLPIKEGSYQLVYWCTQYCAKNDAELLFLTAVPRNNDIPWSFYDKVRWAEKHFPNIPVMFGPRSQDKHNHCKPGDVLIDDRILNVNDWRNAGGLAHPYTTWEKCKPWLEEFVG